MAASARADPELTLAVIGAGWATAIQAPAFARAGISLSVVAARTIPKAKQEIERLGATAEASSDLDASARARATVVSIVTPPHTHLPLLRAACESGESAVVLCEKPMALSQAEASEMVKLAADSKAVALVDHELRFLGAFRALRAIVQSGAIGETRSLSAEVHRPDRLLKSGGAGTVLASYNWWSDASLGGGALGAIGSHMYDMMRFVTGGEADLKRTRAMLTRAHDSRPLAARERAAATADSASESRPVTADDRADVQLQLAVGGGSARRVPATIVTSMTSAARASFRFEVVCEDATALYERGCLRVFPHSARSAPKQPDDGIVAFRTTYFGGIASEDAHSGGPPSAEAGSMARNEFSAGTVQIARACRAHVLGEAVATGEPRGLHLPAPADSSSADAEHPERAAMCEKLRAVPVPDLSVITPDDLTSLGATIADGACTQAFLDACRASSAAFE